MDFARWAFVSQSTAAGAVKEKQTVTKRWIITAMLSVLCARRVPTDAETPLPAKTPPKIRVARERHGFVDATGKPFVPFGVNYYRPGTGWPPQLWKQFDAEATRRDFARLKRQGANVVRVFISFGSFFTEPGKLNPEGLAKFDQLLDLADEAGLYVHPTGPDAWEGMPAWTKDLNVFSNDTNEPCLKTLENYWRLFAARIAVAVPSGLTTCGMSHTSPGIPRTYVFNGLRGARHTTRIRCRCPSQRRIRPHPSWPTTSVFVKASRRSGWPDSPRRSTRPTPMPW